MYVLIYVYEPEAKVGLGGNGVAKPEWEQEPKARKGSERQKVTRPVCKTKNKKTRFVNSISSSCETQTIVAEL